MWVEFQKWLGALPPSSASFLGTMTGSALGLVALLIGALFNALLNRRRDDRIRNHEGRSVAAALRAELRREGRSLVDNAKVLEEQKGDGKLIIPDIAQSIRVLSNVIDKLGLLDEETIEAVIDAHIVIEQYFGTLILHGGEALDYGGARRSVMIPSGMSSRLRGMNLGVNDIIQKAIEKLSKHLD
jgi:hypothetical protein